MNHHVIVIVPATMGSAGRAFCRGGNWKREGSQAVQSWAVRSWRMSAPPVASIALPVCQESAAHARYPSPTRSRRVAVQSAQSRRQSWIGRWPAFGSRAPG